MRKSTRQEFAASASAARSCSDLSLPAGVVSKVWVWTWPCRVTEVAKAFFLAAFVGWRDPDDLSHARLPLGLRLSVCEPLQHSLSRAESSLLLCLSIAAVEGGGRASAPPAKQGRLLGTVVLLAGLHERHDDTQPAPRPQGGGHVAPSSQRAQTLRDPSSPSAPSGLPPPRVTPSAHRPRAPSVGCPGPAADAPWGHRCPPHPRSQSAPLRLLLPRRRFHPLWGAPG